MRIEYELSEEDYVQMARRFGLNIDGLMATMALLVGLNLLVSPASQTLAWVSNASWLVTLVVLWHPNTQAPRTHGPLSNASSRLAISLS